MRIQKREKYDMERKKKQKYYEANKSSILKKQGEYKQTNRSIFKKKKAEYYVKNKSLISQKKRFFNYFTKEDASKYLTAHQEHLYQHTLGICQPESMQMLNHSIEYDNGDCQFCNHSQGVKIIGVNRQV